MSKDDRTVAWLIERKNYAGAGPPHWYAEHDDGWHWWTHEPTEAKRFATKVEAEAYQAYRMIADDPAISLTEHVFLGANR